MQSKAPIQPPPPAITVVDIYYVLFKHKWKILTCAALGFVAAAWMCFVATPPFMSEAKLMILYVKDAKSLSPGDDKAIRNMDTRPESIMNAERDIMSSLDVARMVVDEVGAEKILGKNAGTTNRDVAAMALKKSLTVDVPDKGNILRVVMRNTDAEVVQPVLRKVVDAYLKRHVEIHKNLGPMEDMLTSWTDQAKSRLTATEEELRKLKMDASITSLEDAKRSISERMSRVAEELRTSEVELEERKASLAELQKRALRGEEPKPEATNVTVAAKPKLPKDLVDEFRRLTARLEVFRKREQDLLGDFKGESALVREARENVEALEKQKKEMIAANPRLVEEETVAAVAAAKGDVRPDTTAQDLQAENTRVAALVAKIKMLNTQLERVKLDVSALDKMETEFSQLQRKKDLEDTKYRYFSTSLDQARFDSGLSGGQLSNIKEVQSPSLPFKDPVSLAKNIIMTALGGIFFGLGLAFLLEFVIDQSVRRPTEVELKFHLPTFLTIPDLAKKNNRPKLLPSGSSATKALPANGEATSEHQNSEANGTGQMEVAPWDEQHQLHPYSEALRDRLVSFFDLKGLTHKPKLVALTSCSRGAGVTTLAAGLAASLSETGEGNVLLVDMNLDQGAAHPFYRGKPACGLADVLEHEKRPAAMVQDKLYMVHGGSADDRLPKILPKRISHLLPKLQASDYDYIIFDMPPITQTSVTPRLAGFMDMVFVVVEDQKTSREWLKQASALLVASKANLGAVFNKRKTYVPRWLHHEF